MMEISLSQALISSRYWWVRNLICHLRSRKHLKYIVKRENMLLFYRKFYKWGTSMDSYSGGICNHRFTTVQSGFCGTICTSPLSHEDNLGLKKSQHLLAERGGSFPLQICLLRVGCFLVLTFIVHYFVWFPAPIFTVNIVSMLPGPCCSNKESGYFQRDTPFEKMGSHTVI